jgi:hypothetical protein
MWVSMGGEVTLPVTLNPYKAMDPIMEVRTEHTCWYHGSSMYRSDAASIIISSQLHYYRGALTSYMSGPNMC